MKYLVLSDIHGNLDALEAVLRDSLPGAEGILCLGDTVGYGPDASACVDRLLGLRDAGLPFASARGNHDAAVAGMLSTEWFNPHARRAAERTRSLIGGAHKDWLASLPEEAAPPGTGAGGVLLVHGSPLEPVTGYLFGGLETLGALEELKRRGIALCFAGHTHTPAFYSARRGASLLCPSPGRSVRVAPRRDSARPSPSGPLARLIGGGGIFRGGPAAFPAVVNPGSVGFPRSLPDNQDPERYPAEYAFWDSEAGTVTFMNALYDRRPFEARLEEFWGSFE